jgi:hypothetical protein
MTTQCFHSDKFYKENFRVIWFLYLIHTGILEDIKCWAGRPDIQYPASPVILYPAVGLAGYPVLPFFSNSIYLAVILSNCNLFSLFLYLTVCFFLILFSVWIGAAADADAVPDVHGLFYFSNFVLCRCGPRCWCSARCARSQLAEVPSNGGPRSVLSDSPRVTELFIVIRSLQLGIISWNSATFR